MQLRRQNAASRAETCPITPQLTTLNDDCLMLICVQLSIRDQLVLMQLDERLRHLVLAIWRSKYANEFDWQLESQLTWLSATEQSDFLGHMAERTRSLVNLGASDEGLQLWLERQARRCKQLDQLQRISFGTNQRCKSALLLQLPAICRNICQLQLGACWDVTPADLLMLFGQLRQLQVFELLPGGKNSGCICNSGTGLSHIQYCPTLNTLRLPSCLLRAGGSEIARLPQLRQLTGFLCCSGDIEDDKEKANAGAVATATISACLTACSIANDAAGGDSGVACQIVALNLQCQLDGRLPRLLQGHSRVLQLQRFAWHSQLMVHYDAADGSINWLPQQPQVAHALLAFILCHTPTLRELDFTRNVHATPTFLAQLNEHLTRNTRSRQLPQIPQISVWHDAHPCHATRTTPSHIGNRHDLSFVEFEFKRPNDHDLMMLAQNG